MGILKSIKRWKKIFFNLKQMEDRYQRIEKNLENAFIQSHIELVDPVSFQDTLSKKEFSVYSQNGEDGLILYILSQIGIHNRTFVEFGVGDGRQCNCANLLLNFGWQGLFIDGNSSFVRSARTYFANHPKIKSRNSISIIEAFITSENINSIIEDAGIKGEIDILSIDIDGNDYWVWEAISVVQPRVVIIEYNASLGVSQSITVEYDPSFDRFKKHKSGWYHSASLTALKKLGQLKGYELIGCDSNGVNAFFIKKELIDGMALQIQSTVDAYHPINKRAHYSLDEQWNAIRDLSYVSV